MKNLKMEVMQEEFLIGVVMPEGPFSGAKDKFLANKFC